MWFVEWWAGLGTWPKVGVTLLLILGSTIFWLAGRFWHWSWVAGGVLLLFSFPNKVQKRGYQDFCKRGAGSLTRCLATWATGTCTISNKRIAHVSVTASSTRLVGLGWFLVAR
jgi:hypothetical protein